MPSAQKDRLHGTLDALVLKTLSWGPRHGYAITRWIRETSEERIVVEEGSLYPALYRLERAGRVKAEWEQETKGRRGARRRIYRLTAKGAAALARDRADWHEFARVIGGIVAGGAV